MAVRTPHRAGSRLLRHVPSIPPAAVVASFVVAGLAAGALAFFVLPGLVVDDKQFETNVEVPKGASAVEQSKIETEQTAIEERRLKARSDVRWVAVQLIAALALLVVGAITWRTIWMTRQGQISDRFATAVAQLKGSGKQPGVRAAAIHTLGDIARDARAQHPTVMALLANELRSDRGASDGSVVAPRVEAVAAVLKKRRAHWDRGALGLSEVDLRLAPLEGVDLRGADLEDADLRGARLARADLRGARLVRAKLDNAMLPRARLDGADLTGASLRFATLADASLRDANLDDVTYQSTVIDGADLRGAQNLRRDLPVNRALAIPDEQTQWP